MGSVPLLWIVTLLPAVGALSLVLIPDDEANKDAPRGAALLWSTLAFFASLPLFFMFDATASGYQFTYDHAWLPQIGASLKVGVDGIAMLLILLTTFLVPLTVVASWRSVETRVKEFHI